MKPRTTTSTYRGWSGNRGSFSLAKGNWQSCREFFAQSFNSRTKFIYFCTGDTPVSHVIKFMAAVEKKLKLPNAERLSYVKYTNNPSILGIEISNFWRENSMRRSLLTLLIRCAIGHYQYTSYYFERIYKPYIGSFDDTINMCSYMSQTTKALEKFLAGNTRYSGARFSGWITVFTNDRNLEKLVK